MVREGPEGNWRNTCVQNNGFSLFCRTRKMAFWNKGNSILKKYPNVFQMALCDRALFG